LKHFRANIPPDAPNPQQIAGDTYDKDGLQK
jgi:hypothetical protein